jgi:hypothetical protein
MDSSFQQTQGEINSALSSGNIQTWSIMMAVWMTMDEGHTQITDLSKQANHWSIKEDKLSKKRITLS